MSRSVRLRTGGHVPAHPILVGRSASLWLPRWRSRPAERRSGGSSGTVVHCDPRRVPAVGALMLAVALSTLGCFVSTTDEELEVLRTAVVTTATRARASNLQLRLSRSVYCYPSACVANPVWNHRTYSALTEALAETVTQPFPTPRI